MIRYTCDKCEKTINNIERKYIVKWTDKYFSNTTSICLCKKCDNKFRTKWLNIFDENKAIK